MNKIMTNVALCAFVSILLIQALTRAASLPESDVMDAYSPEDIEEAIRMIQDVPQKRGICPKGYTYQAILRNCVPSLGALRGRSLGGRYRTARRMKVLRGRQRGGRRRYN